MISGDLKTKIKVGSTVKLFGQRHVTVTALHSGYYDYEFSGRDDEGVLIYFDANEIREIYDDHR